MPRVPSIRPSLRRLSRHTAFAVFVSALVVWPSGAQNVTEPSLKAAYLYNLAKFTEWPADAFREGAPLNACVVGDTPVGRALTGMVKGRLVMGRPVIVSRVTPAESAKACHVLYITGLSAAETDRVAVGVRGIPVFTIVDVESTGRPGGVAHLFVENGLVRFNIEQGFARQARLQISSKVLALAKRVYDSAEGAP